MHRGFRSCRSTSEPRKLERGSAVYHKPRNLLRGNAPVMHFPSCSSSYPSIRTSWLLIMASRPFLSQNRFVTSGPNCMPTPRLLGPRPGCGWGSVHNISIISPACPGCLCLCRSSLRMSSNVTLSSEKRPPWRTKYFLPIRVARGRAEKLSENNLKTLYLSI